MYVGEGHTSAAEFSRLYRSDQVESGSPVFTQMTSNDPSTSAWDTFNFCTGQCWYDNFVYTPPGHPDIIYIGGSYQYDEDGATLPYVANHRAVLRSTNAGESFNGHDDGRDADVDPSERDASRPAPRSSTNPANPGQFFEASDGGIIRNIGQFVDKSERTATREMGSPEPLLSRCRELLSAIPDAARSMNRGLGTLPVPEPLRQPVRQRRAPGRNPGQRHVGELRKQADVAPDVLGAAAVSRASTRPTRTSASTRSSTRSPEVNFSDGATTDWNVIYDPIFGTEATSSTSAVIS